MLTIPALGLELPVLDECTDALLRVSVCRYMGSMEGAPKDLVVAGHSYKSHFGKLAKLVPGDAVYVTAGDGTMYGYTVTEVLEIAPDDYETLLSGAWDIGLFTCNTDGKMRVLVRCITAE